MQDMRFRRRRRLYPLVAALALIVAVAVIAMSVGGGSGKSGGRASSSSHRTETTAAVARLGRALVTGRDLGSSAWVEDTPAYDDLLVGGLQLCNPRARGPGDRVPAEGLAARSEEHVFMQTNNGANPQELLDQIVAFRQVGGAKAYMDRLSAAATGCPASNGALRHATGPRAPGLGDQVVALQTANVSYTGYELLVRKGDTIVEVAETSDSTVVPDHALLERLARLNLRRLVGGP